MMKDILEIIIIAEAKLDSFFPSNQFKILGLDLKLD